MSLRWSIKKNFIALKLCIDKTQNYEKKADAYNLYSIGLEIFKGEKKNKLIMIFIDLQVHIVEKSEEFNYSQDMIIFRLKNIILNFIEKILLLYYKKNKLSIEFSKA